MLSNFSFEVEYRFYRTFKILVTLGLLFGACSAHADRAVLNAEITSGVAPLAVLFDARDTEDSDVADTFHDLQYEFEFGEVDADPSYNERWGLDGDPFLATLSKDRYVGAPLAGHVYETPGTYTATVRVTDPNGDVTTDSITINVLDPDDVFSGNDTVCYSSSGNFSGCPSGASTITSSSFSQIANQASQNRRVLLRRGDSFSGFGSFSPTVHGIIGAFGSGNRPRVVGTNGNEPVLRIFGVGPRAMDLELVSPVQLVPRDGQALVVQGSNRIADSIEHGLLYRVRTVNGQGAVGVGVTRDREQLSVVDSELGDLADRNDGREGGRNVDGHYTRSMFMGNLIGRSPTSFNMRIFSNDTTVWSFNKFAGGHSDTKNGIRIQAGGNSGGGDVPTEYFVYSYNAYASVMRQSGEIKPPSTLHFNIIQNYIVEGNFFNQNIARFELFGQNASFRNNIKSSPGTFGGGSMVIVDPVFLDECDSNNGNRCTQFPIRNINIYNNSCYFTGNNSRPCTEAFFDTPTGQVESYNNLLYASASQLERVANGPLESRNNLFRGNSSPFVSNNPVDILDFIREQSVANANIGASVDGTFVSAAVSPPPPATPAPVAEVSPPETPTNLEALVLPQ